MAVVDDVAVLLYKQCSCSCQQWYIQTPWTYTSLHAIAKDHYTGSGFNTSRDTFCPVKLGSPGGLSAGRSGVSARTQWQTYRRTVCGQSTDTPTGAGQNSGLSGGWSAEQSDGPSGEQSYRVKTILGSDLLEFQFPARNCRYSECRNNAYRNNEREPIESTLVTRRPLKDTYLIYSWFSEFVCSLFYKHVIVHALKMVLPC